MCRRYDSACICRCICVCIVSHGHGYTTQVLVRFCNSYRIPSYIYSVNARSFDNALGKDIIKHHLDNNEFRNNFISHTISHIKIPLYSPWMGSVWERKIKATKTCLFKTLGRAKSNYFQLLTMISDIQRAINPRPLTYRSTSNTEVLPLMPNAFLHPNINGDISVKTDSGWCPDMEPTSRSQLLDALSEREKLLNNFKELWNEEYLLSLRESCKEIHNMDFNNKIQINDVVLIKNPHHGLRNRSTRVRTPVALLPSLSDKYPWERYEPPYPPSYLFNSTAFVLLGEWLWH